MRVVLAVVLVALTVAAGAFGFHRSPKVGPSQGRSAPAIASVLPSFENCGAPPQFEPRTLPSCPPCSPVIGELTWTTWTTTQAQGTGERATTDCRRRGGPPQPAILTAVTVVLRNPELETFCARNDRGRYTDHSLVVFTGANLQPPIELPAGTCSQLGGRYDR